MGLFADPGAVLLNSSMDGQDEIARLEADLKSDRRGLARAVNRKRRLAAQTLVVLLIGVAYHLLLWARERLVPKALHWGHRAAGAGGLGRSEVQ